MTNLFRSFFVEESGQDMIEYVLILAFVVIGAAAIAFNIGTDIAGIWQQTSVATSAARSAGTFTAGS